MFHKWGFLLSEIWVLLALAALLGLLAGWIIWGRRASVTITDTSEADRLRADLAACNARGKELSGKLAGYESDAARAQSAANAEADAAKAAAAARAKADADAKSAADAASAAAARAKAEADAKSAEAAAKMSAAVSSAAAPAPLAAMAAPLMSAPAPASTERAKPKGLTAARGGKADDLKLVKGIGPKLEQLCHSLGFYHFDQLANWTAAEIAWVDENLEGFKGRVTRDEWVVQARDLAAGKPPRAGGEK